MIAGELQVARGMLPRTTDSLLGISGNKVASTARLQPELRTRNSSCSASLGPEFDKAQLIVLPSFWEEIVIRKTSLRSAPFRTVFHLCGITLVVLSGTVSGWAQENTPGVSPNAIQTDAMTNAIRDLQQQVRELKSAVAEVRSEAAQYRTESMELRQELEMTQKRDSFGVSATENSAATATPESSTANPASSPAIGLLEQRVSALEDASTLLSGKVDEQHQDKVESGSKYSVRLSGIVLMNLFSNRGTVDNQDIPSYATPSINYGSGSNFGATLRQSELGLEVFGPDVAGAKTSGSVQFDFSGGFPDTLNGVNYGLMRLRTASVRLDWKDTSIVAGQDNLFFSPLSPTSFASLSIPAFGYAGNLWGWIPQVRAEHRFNLANGQEITIQGGILDNLSGEPPFSGFSRVAQAGENSGQPAYAARAAWSETMRGQPLSFGTAAYYTRQNWGFNRNVDGWSGMADWSVPIVSRLSFSGEFYRGRAVGALGGGIGQSALYTGDPRDPATQVRGLNSIGGWSQLKFKPGDKLEFNGAFGIDNPLARDFNGFGGLSVYGTALRQNQNALVNFILRPRSDLLFSAEYRHLHTKQSYGNSDTAEQFNLMMGVLF